MRLSTGAVSTQLEIPFLSIVIPAYNEERRIGSTLDTVISYLSRQSYTWEVLVVDDGSTDRTVAEVAGLSNQDARVKLEQMPHGGKGWAIRQGMLAATGRYRFMCDADLSMPIETLPAFLDRMAQGYDVVIGSRQKAGARRFNESLLRHARGRVFNWAVRLVAVSGFQDTQCGFKCFRAEVAQELFERQRTRGLAFDVDVLYTATKSGMGVYELPIDWYHRGSSKVRPLVDSLLMFWDVVLVRLRGLRD